MNILLSIASIFMLEYFLAYLSNSSDAKFFNEVGVQVYIVIYNNIIILYKFDNTYKLLILIT